MSRLTEQDAALNRVADHIEGGHLLASSDPAAFLNAVADRIERLQTVLTEADAFHRARNGCRQDHSRDDCPGCRLADTMREALAGKDGA